MPIQNYHFLPIDYLNQSLLIKLARDSIRCFLATRREASVDPSNFPPPLQQEAACFVTLYHKGKLRGCIGNTKAERPLVAEVVHNAHAAAFEDPRFASLKPNELAELTLEVAILTTPQPICFTSEHNLLEQLDPEVDGITLQEGVHRASFLPALWASYPDKSEFLKQLKVRAGLDANHWSDRIEAWRYRTITITEEIQ